MALPHLKLLVQHPYAMVLEATLDTIAEIDYSLLSLEAEIDLILQGQRIDRQGEQKSCRKHKDIVIAIQNPLNDEWSEFPLALIFIVDQEVLIYDRDAPILGLDWFVLHLGFRVH